MRQQSVVLIVDDELLGRSTLEALLTPEGYHLSCASSGLEALDKASALTPDLILLDVMMPGMDGFEVCRRLRADPVLAEVPVIIVTALDDREARLRGIQSGADDFITKPVDRVELRTRVRTVTRLNRYRRLLVERNQRRQAEEETRQRRHELMLLNRVITSAAATMKVDEILSLACETLAHAFDLPTVTATLLNEQKTRFKVVAAYSAAGQALETSLVPVFSEHIPAGHEILSGYNLADYPLLIDTEAATAPDLVGLQDLVRQAGLSSVRMAPILLRDQIVGTIELHASGRHVFDAQDRALLQSIVTAVGQAMETAQLYRRLQQHAEGLEATVSRRTRELQAERDRTKAILEALGEAVFVTSFDGKIEYLNPAALALTGLSAEDALGQRWPLWHSNGRGPDFYTGLQQALSAGLTWSGEVVNRRQDGTLYDAALTLAPLFDPERPQRAVGLVSVQWDITPIKEAERLKDRFVSNVSHELRTPLSVITLLSGNLDTLYDRLDDVERLKMIKELRGQARVLEEVIDNVLAISHIDSQHELTDAECLDLVRLADQEVAKQLPLARTKSQTVSVIGEGSVMIWGNDSQLRQVIRNLVNNAIKYTPTEGEIKCECRALIGPTLPESSWPGNLILPAGRWAGLRLVDTGRGINPQDLPHLFERFFRAEVEGNVAGSGLGLSIARELVVLHAGHIAVASSPNEGSIFAIYLPLLEDEP